MARTYRVARGGGAVARGLAAVVAIATAALGASCGSSDADECRSFYAVICERQATCNPDNFAVYYNEDVDDCTERFATLCPVLAALPSSNFKSDALSRCTDAIAGSTCAEFNGPDPVACIQAFRGMLQAGDDCVDGSECSSGICFVPKNSQEIFVCGTCAALLAEGDDCSGSKGVCDSGLTCFQKQCAKSLAAGDPCSNAQECGAGLACLSGFCGTPLGVGKSCSNDTECNLDDDLFCDPTTLVCAVIPSAYEGGICFGKETAEQLIPCSAGLFCDFDPVFGVGRCSPQRPDGETCSDSQLNPCIYPSTCVTGTCTLPIAPSCSTTL